MVFTLNLKQDLMILSSYVHVLTFWRGAYGPANRCTAGQRPNSLSTLLSVVRNQVFLASSNSSAILQFILCILHFKQLLAERHGARCFAETLLGEDGLLRLGSEVCADDAPHHGLVPVLEQRRLPLPSRLLVQAHEQPLQQLRRVRLPAPVLELLEHLEAGALPLPSATCRLPISTK